MRELFASGVNLATNSYEFGLAQSPIAGLPSFFTIEFRQPTPNLMEKANSVNLTFRKTGGPLSFEVGLFYQDITDYIFARLVQSSTANAQTANLFSSAGLTDR